MAYLPVDDAVVGRQLAVEYIGDLYPVSVAAVGARALFDPDHLRMRG
jgi:hypothetical protein